MSASDTNHAEPGSRAEAVFLEFLGRGEGGDFEELCTQHPHLAGDLRVLRRDWAFIEDLQGAEALKLTRDAGSDGPRYEIRRELGRGGMGVVYEVWDRELRRRLAVKVSRTGASERGRFRFLEEAQVTAQLDHPGVVPIHELGLDRDGQAYFSMRKVVGQTLGEVFERVGRGEGEWSRTRALGVLVQVCETLAFAHSRGVVHRDLKPANVMVGSFGEVYVMDWGLAKVRESDGPARPRRVSEAWPAVTSVRSEVNDEKPDSPLATLDGAVLGTPAYMPPEQAAGQTDDVGAVGDVYAVGAILYHLLAGAPPYSDAAGPGQGIVDAVRRGSPRPVHRVRPGIPPELVAICDRAMARAPSERYASMEELASDLRAFLENRVVRAHETGPLVEMRKWVARNQPLAAAVGVALLVLMAALVMQLQKVRQLEDASHETAFENYVAGVAMAAHKLEQSDVPAARRHLQACPPELRNWEWTYQWEGCDESAQVFPGGAEFHQGAFHPSEPWLAGASWDGLVSVFDTTTNDTIAQLEAGCTHAMDAAFTSDGRWLLSACTSIRAWDTRTWELAREFETDQEARDLNFAPGDGARFATAHVDGSLRVWNMSESGALAVFSVHDDTAWSAAWSPDGRELASTSADGTIAVTIVETGVTRLRFPARLTVDSWHGGWEVAFSRDGKRLASGQPDGALTVWSADTGELEQILRGHRTQVPQVRFLDEETLVSASADGSLALWHLPDGRRIRHLRGHGRGVKGVAVHPDGASLASFSADGTVRTWDLREGANPLVLETPHGTSQSRLSPDGSLIAAGGSDVKIWETRTGQLVHQLRTGASLAAFSANGSELYVTTSGSPEVRAFAVDSWREGTAFQDASATHQWHLAVDPSGRWLATSTTKDVTLWDVKLRRMIGSCSGRWLPAFHPSGDSIAFGTASNSVVIASCPDLTVTRTLEARGSNVWEVAFDPSGELLAAAIDDGTVRLWNTETGEHLRDIEAHAGIVFTLDFAPDGTRLATGSNDKTVKLWDVKTGKEVLTLAGPRAMVDQVRFATDGHLLLASSNDSKVRLWRTSTDVRAATSSERVARRVLAAASTLSQAMHELERDPALSENLRAAALQLVASSGPRHRESNNTNWLAVRDPGHSRMEYERAVESQRHVCAAYPRMASYFSTLALGLVRMGEYRNALETFERAEELNRASPRGYQPTADRAYTAICLFELGERERALALLGELRSDTGVPEIAREALAEAEARLVLITDKP